MNRAAGRRGRGRRRLPGLPLAAVLALTVAAPVAARAQPPPGEEPAPAPGEPGEPMAPAPAPEGGAEAPAPARYASFEIPVPPEKGGGTVVGSAGSVEFVRKDLVRLTEGVELRYRDLKIQAQSMEADLAANEVTAVGEVILDQGPRRLTGATLHYRLDQGTGTLTEASAYVDPDFYFTGKQIAKVGEDSYAVEDGLFTSCTDRVPDWSFRVSSARVRVDGFARARNVRMRAKKAPFLYFPYLLWPAKSDRTSGLLVPNIGYSERRGGYLGLAWFQTLGRSYDSTFYVDLYGEEYYGLGGELRYVPSETTRGNLQVYGLEDGVLDERRWKVNWNHVSERLPGGFRGAISYIDYSDFEFFRDFERDYNDASLRSVYASAFLSKTWGPHSLNFLADDRETFIGTRTITQRQLPELEYRLRPTRLGSLPVYLELLGSAHYLSTRRSQSLAADYARADFFPQFTVPLATLPWLSLSVGGGARMTWYEDRLDAAGTAFTGESLTRVFPTAEAAVVGPSFSRVFDGDVGSFAKFKHIIEPRWTYTYVDEFDDQDLVPLFDEVDSVRSLNLGSLALVNRLLAKPKDEALGETREILSLEFAQAYSFDDQRPLQQGSGGTSSRRGPLSGRLRFSPASRLSVDTQAIYNTLSSNLSSTSLSSSYRSGDTQLGVTWFTRYNAESGESTGNQVRFFSGFDLVRDRLRLDAQLNYDFELALFQQQRYIFNYTSDCYGFRLELREINLGDRRERDYRFAVDLKNVGTFLDLTGGLDSESLR